MTADVRIGIVSWNVAEELERCLDALPAALGDLEAEVVVVDNHSRDNSADVAARFDGAVVVRSPRNLGYARGMNQALANTEARALLALNPDTVPSPGSIARLVQALDDHPDVGLVVPLLVGEDGEVEHSVHRFPTVGVMALANLVPPRLLPRRVRDRLWLRGSIRPGRTGPIDWAVGAVHCIRRDAIEPPGPYWTRWFIYVEDVDLCWRLREDGWGIRLESGVVVNHVGGASTVQAFGLERAVRWSHETYDWQRTVQGPWATRVVALLNLLGLLGRLPIRLLHGRLPRRQWSALLSLLRVHARTAVFGASPPLPPPSPVADASGGDVNTP